jgi:hypothetical protein
MTEPSEQQKTAAHAKEKKQKHGTWLAAIAITASLLLNWSYTTWNNYPQDQHYHSLVTSEEHHDAQLRKEQAEAGVAIEAKLCTTLDKLGAIQPPSGLSLVVPQVNPGRSYDEEQHAVLAQLGPDIQCPLGLGAGQG